jgi:hypothetical protein
LFGNFVLPVKTIYDHVSKARKGNDNFPAGPDLYRSMKYSRNNDIKNNNINDKSCDTLTVIAYGVGVDDNNI